MTSSLVSVGIGGLAVIMGLLAGIGYGQAGGETEPRGERDRRAGMAVGLITVWMVATGLLAQAGTLLRFDLKPPPMAVMMAVALGMAFAIGLSPVGKRLAGGLSLGVLVFAQAFRFPLELLMHRAYTEGAMPVQLSYSGYNFDIVTGLLATVLGALLLAGKNVPRGVILAWNFYGFLCLAVIAFVAVAGSPLVKLFGDSPENVNTFPLHFPFVWLPTVLVVIALVGHIVIVRKLMRS